MANTMTLIQSVTVPSGGSASIDFTSIPSTYTDLCIKVSGRSSRANATDGLRLQFNGSSSAVYSTRRLYAYSTTPASDSLTGSAFIYADPLDAATNTASTFTNTEIYVPNYAGSVNHSVSLDTIAESNTATPYMTLSAGLWANATPIVQVTLTSDVGSFVQYSTAYLYGIKSS